ncbi:unnamed protein product [Discosporangium mesarthrocarpum]
MNVQGVDSENGWSLDPLPCIDSSDLIRRLTDRAFFDVRRLTHTLHRVNLDERRLQLLDYVREYRARFLKSYVAVRWLSESHGTLVSNASEALSLAQSQSDHIDTCQDQLFFMHGGLFGARQRMYDVPAAVDVLMGGTFPRLPKGIEFCGGDMEPSPQVQVGSKRSEVVSRIERAIRLALLRREPLPMHFTSHSLRNGVLHLVVEGEFELMVTLEGEEHDSTWVLAGVHIKVQAEKGEAVAEPPRDPRQQRYLHEVVQKAMDMHGQSGVVGSSPLLAAYHLCHDLCSGIVLEVLNAQAQALSARVGGLWGNNLRSTFHKEAQARNSIVLDLWIWEREFSTGLAGTGKDVGVGGVQVDTAAQQAGRGLAEEETGLEYDLPAPQGCRYLRLYRSQGQEGQIMVALGPVNDFLVAGVSRDSTTSGSAAKDPQETNRAGARVLCGAVNVKPDKLSCNKLLLATARIFASRKMVALAEEMEMMVQQICQRAVAPGVRVVGGMTVQICPWERGCVDVSLDLQSGRFLVHHVHSGNSSMGRCLLQLQEALNLHPNTEQKGCGPSIAAALSGKGEMGPRQQQSRVGTMSSTEILPESGEENGLARAENQTGKQSWEQQDLRKLQVYRCLWEAFRWVRLEEIELDLRCRFGLMPHQRWQALLGKGNPSLQNRESQMQPDDTVTMSRTYSSLCEFREIGLGVNAADREPCGAFDRVTHYSSGRAVSTCNGWSTLADRTRKGDISKATSETKGVRTGEIISFFVEFSVTGSLDLGATLVASAVPIVATGAGHVSVRPVVVGRYNVTAPKSSQSHTGGGSETVLGKRSSNGRLASEDTCQGRSSTLGGSELTHVEGHCVGGRETSATPTHAQSTTERSEATEGELDSILRLCHVLIPIVRLNRAFCKTGSGLMLKCEPLPSIGGSNSHSAWTQVVVPRPEAWSMPPLVARSLWVRYLPSHDHFNCWEWRVELGMATQLLKIIACGIVDVSSTPQHVEAAQLLPLLSGVTVAQAGTCKGKPHEAIVNNQEAEDDSKERDLGGQVYLLFPRQFPVYAMCMSMELAGEGLHSLLCLSSQAARLMRSDQNEASYRVVAVSPLHLALHHPGQGHVLLVSHSSFCAERVSSAESPGLVLIPSDSVPTCPAALLEIQVMLRKHLNLEVLLHNLSRVVPPLADLARVVPGVGLGEGAEPVDQLCGSWKVEFLLMARNPFSYTLSYTCIPTHGHSMQLQKGNVEINLDAEDKIRVCDSTGERLLESQSLKEFASQMVSNLKQNGIP